MLHLRRPLQENSFAKAIERYLVHALHIEVQIHAMASPAGLPVFLERLYTLYRVTIVGRPIIILAARKEPAPVSDIAKHAHQVRRVVADDTIVVFAAPFLSAHNRSRLVEHGIAFIVPDNQLYLPDLAVDLREHFRAQKPDRSETGLSPVAQAVLFYYLLHSPPALSPPALAHNLHVTRMSIGRAFDELITLELADDDRQGRERHIRFRQHGRELLNTARNQLRSPVRSIRYVIGMRPSPPLKLAGESALAQLTDLNRPTLDSYAIAARSWKHLADDLHLVETDKNDGDFIIEAWSYDPSGLATGPEVDPLSLYAQFKDHSDERVAGAAEQLLERIPW
jgi:hypothetical protein